MGLIVTGGSSGSAGPTVVLTAVAYSLFPVNLTGIEYGD